MLLPVAFLSIVPAFIVEFTKYDYYSFDGESEEIIKLYEVVVTLFIMLQILGPVANLISCFIIALTIRLIYKLSK